MRNLTIIIDLKVSDDQTDEEAVAQASTALTLCDFETTEVFVPAIQGV